MKSLGDQALEQARRAPGVELCGESIREARDALKVGDGGGGGGASSLLPHPPRRCPERDGWEAQICSAHFLP